MSSPVTPSITKELQTLLPDLQIITSSSPTYQEAISRWFFLSARPAGAVVYPATAQQVSAILKFTSQHTLPIAVKGGGHGLRGESSTDGGIVIDLSLMKGINVDQTNKKIITRGGATWSEVYVEAEKHGLAAVGGVCPDVGVGGFVLHGGYGFLTSEHGLGCDNLLEVEVVLADGSIVRASEHENQDLFWAMRGAGGCFGVVTEFVLQGYEQRNEVWSGKMVFSRGALRAVTEIGNRIVVGGIKGNPVMGVFWTWSENGMKIAIVPFYNGPEHEAREFYAPLLDLQPEINETKMMPFSQTGDSATAAGKWRKLSVACSMIPPMNVDFLEERMNEFEAFLDKMPDAREQSIMGFEFLGTAKIITVKQHETAFADRGKHGTVRAIPIYTEQANDAVCKEWCLSMEQRFQKEFEHSLEDPLLDEVTRSSVGVYLNYDGFGLSPDAIFGGNLERLVELKKRYDPYNVFKACIDLL